MKTINYLLGYKDYKIVQDKNLYKFTSDAIILSRFATCKRGDAVADICSGSGIVGLHFYALNEGKVACVTDFELQKSLSDLAKKSVEINGLKDKFFFADGRLQDNAPLYREKFSLVLCNPPYKKIDGGEKNLSPEIAICRHEVEITQREILSCAFKILKNGGRLCMCQRVERFAELICDMEKERLNPSRVQFVSAGADKKPYLVLIEGYKSIKRPFTVLQNYINEVK